MESDKELADWVKRPEAVVGSEDPHDPSIDSGSEVHVRVSPRSIRSAEMARPEEASAGRVAEESEEPTQLGRVGQIHGDGRASSEGRMYVRPSEVVTVSPLDRADSSLPQITVESVRDSVLIQQRAVGGMIVGQTVMTRSTALKVAAALVAYAGEDGGHTEASRIFDRYVSRVIGIIGGGRS